MTKNIRGTENKTEILPGADIQFLEAYTPVFHWYLLTDAAISKMQAGQYLSFDISTAAVLQLKHKSMYFNVWIKIEGRFPRLFILAVITIN